MPIKFMCPVCFKELTAPDETAGNVGNCPRCGEKLRVPQKAEPILEEKGEERTASVPAKSPTNVGRRIKWTLAGGVIGIIAVFIVVLLLRVERTVKPVQEVKTIAPINEAERAKPTDEPKAESSHTEADEKSQQIIDYLKQLEKIEDKMRLKQVEYNSWMARVDVLDAEYRATFPVATGYTDPRLIRIQDDKLEALEKALDLAGQLPDLAQQRDEILFQLGLVYLEKNMREEAAIMFQRIMKSQDPTSTLYKQAKQYLESILQLE